MINQLLLWWPMRGPDVHARLPTSVQAFFGVRVWTTAAHVAQARAPCSTHHRQVDLIEHGGTFTVPPIASDFFATAAPSKQWSPPQCPHEVVTQGPAKRNRASGGRVCSARARSTNAVSISRAGRTPTTRPSRATMPMSKCPGAHDVLGHVAGVGAELTRRSPSQGGRAEACPETVERSG